MSGASWILLAGSLVYAVIPVAMIVDIVRRKIKQQRERDAS